MPRLDGQTHAGHRHPAELSAFVDDELGWMRRRRLKLHLRRCEPCRRYVEQLRLVVALIEESRLGTAFTEARP